MDSTCYSKSALHIKYVHLEPISSNNLCLNRAAYIYALCRPSMDVFRSTHNLLNLSFYLLCVFYTMTVFYLTLQFILSLTVFLCEYSNFRLCYYFTLKVLSKYYVSSGYNKSLSWVVWGGDVPLFFFWNDPSSDEQSLMLRLPG